MPCDLNLPNTPDELVAQTTSSWKELLKDHSKWQTIPMLNYTPLHKLKDQTLVRFRGMVQDMMDPEIYLERYEVKSSEGDGSQCRLQEGKYRDCLRLREGEVINYNAEANVQGERRTLFVVSVPGLNDWAKEHERECNPQQELVSPGETTKLSKKRTLEKQQPEQMDVEEEDTVVPVKRSCMEQLSAADQAAPLPSSLASEFLLNSPLPSRPSMACMVKVYEEFDTYQLNSLVDFVGFLSVDPSLDASSLDLEALKDMESLSELQAANPSPFLIPRLHAFAVQTLPHANPLLDLSLKQTHTEEEYPSAETLHKDLRMLLKLCLFDDDLAAQYMLCHLISTVYNRSEMQSIGKFALNICNLPRECLEHYTSKLYQVLELLLPASHYLPMTLDNMNTLSFAPKKDYETNKLVSGLLQLAPHTHLVLDETRLQQGKLEASGVQAVQHLAHVINNQQLKCDFKYYHIDYNADIPILVLSEGRSMLPYDFALPLNADAKAASLVEESLKAALHYLQPGRLQQFRKYLTLARSKPFSVGEEVTGMIQQDFVDMRKANVKSNGEDLHNLLVLSRLLGIACGKETLDKETWQLATEYEAKRRQRLQSLPRAATQMRS